MSKKKRQILDWGMEALHGSGISKKEAQELEARLKTDSQDLAARAALLGYYSNCNARTKAAKRRQIEHILWTIEHAPECDLGKTPTLHISKKENPEAFEKAKKLILLQCKRFANKPEVLADLGCMLRHEDMETAEIVLRQAYSVSKKRARIAFWLSQILFRFGKEQNDSAKMEEAVNFMQEVVNTENNAKRFDSRFWLAKMAFDSGQIALAKSVSQDILKNNSENNGCVHVAHIVLGQIALHSGDTPLAIEHLLQAGRVCSSPRLVSYGPLMKLAQDLLASGYEEPVVQYLEDCKNFWEMGSTRLPKWIGEIKRGETPTLQGDDW